MEEEKEEKCPLGLGRKTSMLGVRGEDQENLTCWGK